MVSQADADAGSRLEELVNAGLAEETILFYYANPQTQGVVASMASLAAIEALGDRAAELRSMIGSLKPEGLSPGGTTNHGNGDRGTATRCGA